MSKEKPTEMMKKYGSRSHENGICLKTGKRYETYRPTSDVPLPFRPIGTGRYFCNQCHSQIES